MKNEDVKETIMVTAMTVQTKDESSSFSPSMHFKFK